ncbi:arabinosyltransferase [Allosaccharopolyspora coralli]|uniref:Arabinosyltransferase n=1 Tax=Allosaccharopolyspora coralli TaxID=2665642 RepID=A0A5Q3Q177_9PSEU|nr:arabinosyltransferase domain-containing protein [Allosaccharopolyspora coralli]QGK68281.1 arabinosyltransferase [Allosaccharopolyspora coralli]
MGEDSSTPGDHSESRRRAHRENWWIAGLAVLTLVLAGLVTVAPVRAEDPIVTWPKAGQEPVSTVMPLSPWRPLEFDATVPCSTLRAVDARGGGTALSTQPNGGPGLGISAQGGTARFWVSGQDVLVEPVRAGNCSYQVIADADGVRVLRDGSLQVSMPEMLPPQVAELATDAEGLPEAAGLAVELHTDNRYAHSPTPLKIALLAAHLLALGALLFVAWRRWRGSQSIRGLRRPRFGVPDALVVLISLAWVFLGPANMDDGWYLQMARNASESGYVGNFVYMFNVTENPFVLSQYLLQFWGELGGWSLWWMRLVPVGCALVTWALLRVLLASILGRSGGPWSVPWALLVAHLVWFLPYGLTLRPEPVIVMCAAATLVFTEAAFLRKSVGALAIAVVFAALAMTVSPSGIVAAAPLVLSLLWLVPWMRRQGWSARIAASALAAAAATVVVPVGFADATLADVVEATRVHRWYYLSFPWYEEFGHYQTLLNTAGWARRLPVLLTLAILVIVAIASGRDRMGRDPIRRLVVISAITTAIALALIALTPTKWVNHFHAVAAAPTVLLAAALLRSPLPRRAGPVITTVAVLLLVGAASLSFDGANWWIPFTDAGQRFGNHLDPDPATNNLAPHFGDLYLRNPLLWIGVAVLAWLWARWRRSSGKPAAINPDRAVIVAASIGSVLLMVALFVWAPIGQHPGWTVARGGVQTMFGDGCGIADDVSVQVPTAQQLGPPDRPPQRVGDFANERPVPVNTEPWGTSAPIWHDEQPDGTTTGTGSLTTGWYPLPAEGSHVTLPIAGAINGQEVRMEFARATPGGPEPEDSVVMGGDIRRPHDEWQQLAVPIPQPRPDLVRVVATDRITGVNTWFAVAEPKVTEARPISELTDGKVVFANHIAAGLWPCVNQVSIRHGLTDTPSIRMTTDEWLPPEWPDNISNLTWGGAWMQTSRAWVQTKLAAELAPGGPPRLPWGQVFAVRYLHPVDQYDLRVDHEVRSGLTGFPTLADNDYPVIERNPGYENNPPEEEAEGLESEADSGGSEPTPNSPG